jgi:hypothetical protein
VAAERRRIATAEAAEPAAQEPEPGAAPPSFPIPPLDLPHYHGVDLGGAPGLDVGLSQTGTSSREVTGA